MICIAWKDKWMNSILHRRRWTLINQVKLLTSEITKTWICSHGLPGLPICHSRGPPCLSPRLQSPGSNTGAGGDGGGEAGREDKMWWTWSLLTSLSFSYPPMLSYTLYECTLGTYLEEVHIWHNVQDHSEIIKTVTSHLSSAFIYIMDFIQYMNGQVGDIWYLYFSNELN